MTKFPQINIAIENASPDPIYRQIANQLRHLIDSSNLKEGTVLPGVDKIAILAGVGLGTAHKAVNELIKDGTCFRRPKKGTFVGTRAAKIQQARTKIISLVIPHIDNPHYGPIARAIESAAHARGYYLTVCNSCNELGKQQEYIDDILQGNRAEGIIIAPVESVNKPSGIIAALAASGKPFVSIKEPSSNETDKYWSVSCDGEYGAFMATSHLINLGHRDIGIFIVNQRIWC